MGGMPSSVPLVPSGSPGGNTEGPRWRPQGEATYVMCITAKED